MANWMEKQTKSNTIHMTTSLTISSVKQYFYLVFYCSLKELGVDETKLEPCKFPGGETEGLRRLNEKISIANGTWVRSFEKPQTSPNSLEPSTTVLSPYLKFGCVSCRELYYKLLEVNSKGQENSE